MVILVCVCYWFVADDNQKRCKWLMKLLSINNRKRLYYYYYYYYCYLFGVMVVGFSRLMSSKRKTLNLFRSWLVSCLVVDGRAP
jgi:choline-glycine betaine transporter